MRTKFRGRLVLLAGPAIAAIALLLTASAASASHALVSGGVQIHWQDGGSADRAYVYWSDQTGAEWPVYTEALAWDQASSLDAIYRSSSQSCTSGHCVDVQEAPYANCDNILGQSTFNHYSSGHLTSGNWSRVDQDCGSKPYNARRELLCHEMGHSIGLADKSSTSSSCMRTGLPLGSAVQNSHDYDELAIIYGHND